MKGRNQCLLAQTKHWEASSSCPSLPQALPGRVCPLPAHHAITWPDDGFQQGDPSGQELQLGLLLQEAL